MTLEALLITEFIFSDQTLQHQYDKWIRLKFLLALLGIGADVEPDG